MIRMKIKNIFTTLCLLAGIHASGQLPQKYDSLYKRIYLEDAINLIRNDPNILVLDVRSPGEYADSGKSLSLNLGRLAGAKNIPIDSIKSQLKTLEPYRDKKILVYCSHSQRSRRVSKYLTENGFTSVYNVNGGMSLLNELSASALPGKSAVYSSNLPFHWIQSEDAFDLIRDHNNLIVDLRPESEYSNADPEGCNNIGRIAGALNIPADQLDGRIASILSHKDRPVLLYDMDGSKSPKAALALTSAGFLQVFILFQGLPALIENTNSSSALRMEIFEGLPGYKIVGAKEAIDLVSQKKKNLLIADLRPENEFHNNSSTDYLNLGHLKDAINIPSANLDSVLKNKPKTTPVLVYGSFAANMKMSGMPGSFDFTLICKHLVEEGYRNVYLLYNGLYAVVWGVFNIKSLQGGISILSDHKGLY